MAGSAWSKTSKPLDGSGCGCPGSSLMRVPSPQVQRLGDGHACQGHHRHLLGAVLRHRPDPHAGLEQLHSAGEPEQLPGLRGGPGGLSLRGRGAHGLHGLLQLLRLRAAAAAAHAGRLPAHLPGGAAAAEADGEPAAAPGGRYLLCEFRHRKCGVFSFCKVGIIVCMS